ncbi:MAG: hypothetical protein JXQ93_13355 [Flavobacteriaceae bacterium]
MIFIAVILFISLFLVNRIKGPFAALCFYLATKSVLDAMWTVRIGPFSPISIGGIINPLLFFMVFRSDSILSSKWKNMGKGLFICISFSLVLAVFYLDTIMIFERIFVHLNLYLGFLLIPVFVRTKKDFKYILISLIVASIFPILVTLFQFLSGNLIYERKTAGLIRYVGFYHDAFPPRFYGSISLFSVMIYLDYFKPKGKKKILFLTLGFLSILTCYLAFSKAAVLIILSWVVIYAWYSKSKVKIVGGLSLFLVFLFLIFGNKFVENVEQLFSKEMKYNQGNITDARRTLAGRGYIWEEYYTFWADEQTFFYQTFGDGIPRPTHNEYLRLLLVNGYLGLITYAIILISVLIKILFFRGRFKKYALMLFAMIFIDNIGLTTTDYYHYNIILWGLMGVFLAVNKKAKFLYNG